MTISTLSNIDRLIGFSTDLKPTSGIANGSVFSELDTSKTYIFLDGNWYLDPATIVADNPTASLDTALFDAFGRQRSSGIFTVYDIKQNTSEQPLFYDDQEVSGSGTSSTYLENKAATRLSVSNLTAGVRVKQTKMWAQYQPGKSQLNLISFNMKGQQNGITKRIGIFWESFGFFFESLNLTTNFVIRTYNTGSAVDTRVEQANWNLDKLDGTGPSAITLNLEKINLLVVDYEWLGVGRVRFGFKINGKIVYCHQYIHANVLDEVYMSNPNAPIRFEISNDGTGPAADLDSICVSVQSEGGQEETSLTTYVSRDGSPITLAGQDLFTPVLSVRLKNTRPCTRVRPEHASIILTTATNYEWAVFINPTIGGTDGVSWVDVTNSAIQFDISRDNTNTLTGGYKTSGGYGSSSNQIRIPVGEIIKPFLTIGTSIDGVSDEYVLGVKNIDGDNGTCYAGLTLSEYC